MDYDKSKQVQIYKQELKENKNTEIFNFYAFVFSTLYFIRVGMGLYFLIFMFLPWAIMFPIYVFGISPYYMQIGFAVSHIIAGFVANPGYNRHKKRFIKTYEHFDITKPVEYFPISVVRLCLCTVISAGLYLMYWGYRNWNAYKKTTHDAVNPCLRGLIIPLTASNLFCRIEISVKPEKELESYGLQGGWLLFLGSFFVGFFNVDGYRILMYPAILALIFLYSLFFVPVQQQINRHTVEDLHKSLNQKFYIGEIAAIITGICLNLWILASILR